jgi:hypothetical protein
LDPDLMGIRGPHLRSEGLVIEMVDDGRGTPGEQEAADHQRTRPDRRQGSHPEFRRNKVY